MTDNANIPAHQATWNGFARRDFTLDSVSAIMVSPRTAAPGNPWIWRARFWDAWPSVDLALVKRGFHLAHIDVADLYGGPEAMRRFDLLYDHLTKEHQLAARPVLEGFSRGALAVYNWAARHPEQLCCIYADAPVCDFMSWPAGKGLGSGSPDDWRKCLAAYGITDNQALGFEGNPIDNLQPLAQRRVPIIHVCGELDETAPVAENTAILAQRYRNLGGQIKIIMKPGVGHHPHSLEDPTPVVKFILQAWAKYAPKS